MDKIEVANDILLGSISEMLAEGREVKMTPKGSSMHPFIRGDVDSVTLARKDYIGTGDIVLARIGKRYVMHRIIRIDGDDVTLMGDGNTKGVEKCTTADICGTVIAITTPSGRSRTPGKGRLWRALKPIRRYLLAIYRKIII